MAAVSTDSCAWSRRPERRRRRAVNVRSKGKLLRSLPDGRSKTMRTMRPVTAMSSARRRTKLREEVQMPPVQRLKRFWRR
jgi:hypothetical protein